VEVASRAQDRTIQADAQNATLRLMEHRWEAVQEVGSARAYAKELGVDKRSVDSYVRAWSLWTLETGDGAVLTRSPNDVLELAKLDAERAEATKIVADVKGQRIATVRKDADRIRPVEDRVAP